MTSNITERRLRRFGGGATSNHQSGPNRGHFRLSYPDNSYGQLGDGTTTHRLTPTRVVGISDAVQVTAGGTHTCARHADGSVSCWGRNQYGQLGDGTTTHRLTPTPVVGLVGGIQLTAGYEFTCAGHADRSASCWGRNSYGQLGDGTTTHRLTPTPVVGLP